MLQEIAKGYIKKQKKLRNHEYIKQEVAQYEGNLKIGDKQIVVEVFTKDVKLEDGEIFVKLSTKIRDSLYGAI